MELINVFVGSSIVIVVVLFLVFLYQNQQLKNYDQYNFDTDPSIIESDNTYKLICPEGYAYDRTENGKDICIPNGEPIYDNDNKKITDIPEELSFDTLKIRDEFVYPNDENTNLQGITDRCVSMYSNPNLINNWDSLIPYCNDYNLKDKTK